MRDISIESARQYGIENKHSIMDNGERRFRQVCLKDKTSYIRAESGDKGYWQNSHYHRTIKELYIIQKGSILLAKYAHGKLEIKKVNEDEYFVIGPNTPHNIYMFPNTITHTIKYGKINDNDWIPYEELDNVIKQANVDVYQFN